MDKIIRERAVLIGLAVTVLVAVVQGFVSGEVTLETVVPLVTGIITRFFVSPATPGV